MEFFDLKLQAEAAALRLQVSGDEFSYRVTQPSDPLFWIRVETGGAAPVISDFRKSGLDNKSMAIALTLALEEAGYNTAHVMTFRDIPLNEPGFESDLRAILGLYAKRKSRFLTKIEQLQRSGKTDLRAEISA